MDLVNICDSCALLELTLDSELLDSALGDFV